MGATLTVTSGTSEMIRLVGDQLLRETSQQNLYTVPPKGEYTFQITGYALPFEMRKAEEYGGGMQTMTRLEFTITEGKGAGKMWTELYGFSIGQKSNLGNLLRRLKVDLSPDDKGEWDLDRAMGYTGRGYGVPSDKLDDVTGKPRNFKLSLDTVEAVSAPEKAYSIIIEPRESVGAAAGNGAAAPADDGWE